VSVKGYYARALGHVARLLCAPILVVSLLPCHADRAIAAGTDAVRAAGDVLQLILPASAAALTFAHRDRTGTIEFAESAAVSMGLTYALKFAIHERRPDGGSHSFPSGHTAISFCSAEFIRERYGWRSGIPAFAAASFVGYSRVESKEHYVHDVLAGAAIGMIGSAVLTRSYKGCCLRAAAGSGGGSTRWLRFEIIGDSRRRP
jgi:membrane-associated phospholipid phosphatase